MYLTNIVFWLIQMNDLIETTPELAVILFPVLNYSKNVLNLPYLNFFFFFFATTVYNSTRYVFLQFSISQYKSRFF